MLTPGTPAFDLVWSLIPTGFSKEATIEVAKGGAMEALEPQVLQQAEFCLPLIHDRCERIPALKARMSSGFLQYTDQFLTNLGQMNQFRYRYIEHLARLFAERGLKVLFIKGAAELIWFSQCPEYSRLRILGDTDVLCRPQDLEALDAVLQHQGQQLFWYDCANQAEAKQHSLEAYSHYVYNVGQLNHLEVHPQVTAEFNRGSYPDSFTEYLWQTAVCRPLGDVPVYVPSPEAMVVYLLCHDASLKDHYELLSRTEHSFDTAMLSQSGVGFMDRWRAGDSPRYYHRFYTAMLRLLVRLQTLRVYLTRTAGPVHGSTLKALLDSVQSPLLPIYLGFAAQCYAQAGGSPQLEEGSWLASYNQPWAVLSEQVDGVVEKFRPKSSWNKLMDRVSPHRVLN